MDRSQGGAAGCIVPADRVTVAREPVRVGSPASAAVEPKIHLVREDGVIQAIEVTCTCGQRINIVCEYS